MPLDRDRAEKLINLPWRGPITKASVRHDAPDEVLPVCRGKYHIRVFTVGDPEEAAACARVLEQAELGVSEILQMQVRTVSTGFSVFMLWRNLYMCDVTFRPPEMNSAIEEDMSAMGPDIIFPGSADQEEHRVRSMTRDVDLSGLLKALDRQNEADTVEARARNLSDMISDNVSSGPVVADAGSPPLNPIEYVEPPMESSDGQ